MAVLNKSLFISLAVLAVVLGSAEAQYDCASQLVDCYKFINSNTTPDNDCCSNIKNAINTQLKCLCTLYTTPGLLQQFNITLDQALKLSSECNASTDLSACNSSAASPSSVPGSTGSDKGDASAVAWAGVTSLFLLCASMLLS